MCLFCTAVHSYIFSKHCCHLIFLYTLTYAFEVNKKRALTYAFHCVICPLFLFKRAEAVERIGKPLFQRALPRQETSSSVRRCLSQTSQLTALMSLSTNLWHNSKQAMEVQSRHICDRCKFWVGHCKPNIISVALKVISLVQSLIHDSLFTTQLSGN